MVAVIGEREPIQGQTIIKPFNSLEAVFFNQEEVKVNLLEPNDPCVTNAVWPMVEAAFARYTNDGKGNDHNGDTIRLTKDRFDILGKSKVVTAVQDRVVLGSFRIVIGNARQDIQPPIDAMILMNSHEWPNPQKNNFSEFGRFVIHPNLERKQKMLVLRDLYARAMDFTTELGSQNSVFVILADHVSQFVNNAGINVELYTDASLNWGNPEAEKIFSLYPRYWKPDSFYLNTEPPKLYRYIPEMRNLELLV